MEGLEALWFVRAGAKALLDDLDKALGEAVGKLENLSSPDVVPDLHCVVYNAGDGPPRRAVVLSAHQGVVNVLCVDNGLTRAVPPSAIFKLPSIAVVQETPKLARKLTLFGWNAEEFVMAESEETLETFVRQFCDVSSVDTLRTVIDIMGGGLGPDGLCSVSVLRESADGTESLDLAAELVEEGIVRAKESPIPPGPAPLFPSLAGFASALPAQGSFFAGPMGSNPPSEPEDPLHDPNLLPPQPSQFKLYVGDLTTLITEKMLYEHFSQFGALHDWSVVRDRDGNSRCFGFVTYRKNEGLEAAFKARPHWMDGNKLYIKPSKIVTEEDEDEENNVAADPETKQIVLDCLGPLTLVQIKDFFSQFGEVTRVARPEGRNFGFIDFKRPHMVEAALAAGPAFEFPNAGVFVKARKSYERRCFTERGSSFEPNPPLPPWEPRMAAGGSFGGPFPVPPFSSGNPNFVPGGNFVTGGNFGGSGPRIGGSGTFGASFTTPQFF